jgi:hypothetical protein
MKNLKEEIMNELFKVEDIRDRCLYLIELMDKKNNFNIEEINKYINIIKNYSEVLEYININYNYKEIKNN